jgi:hypothetical protein
MANEQIRILAKAKGVPLWRIAHEIGISEPSMTRKLRFEIPQDERKRFIEIIEKLAGDNA